MITGWKDGRIHLVEPDKLLIKKTQSWTKSGNQDVPDVSKWTTIH